MDELAQRFPAHSAELTQRDSQPEPVQREEALDVADGELPAAQPAEGAEDPSSAAGAAPEPPAPAMPPATEAATGPQAEQQQQQRPLSWKQLREIERQKKAAEQELLAERARALELERRLQAIEQERLAREQQPGWQQEAVEADPIEQQNQRIAQLEAQLARQAEEAALAQQAAAFTQQHPDYPQAFNFYVEQETRRAQESGELADAALKIRQRVPQIVRQAAVQHGITEDEASQRIAFEVLFEERRQRLINGARVLGRNPAEVVYTQAQLMGWNGNGNARNGAGAAPAAAVSAAERVRAEQAATAASSVQAMARTGSAPPPRIQSRADLMAMDPEARAEYIEKMDRADPNWHTRLA